MSQQPSRHQRSTGGMAGALVITVVVVLGYVGFRAFNTDNQPTPVRTVDYQSWVRAGRDDGKLHTYAPRALPTGWRATSATYTTGIDPHWHLGMLTRSGEYVGIEESLGTVSSQVQQYVDANATRDGSATVGGVSWQVWRDSGGDYALVRRTAAPHGRDPETVLVVGSAPDAQIRSFAGTLAD
jgi:hypothetical protein